MKKIAINGFGRIGRLALRAILENKFDDLQVVAINDLAPGETNAHLFEFDSIHGKYAGSVHIDGSDMVIDKHKIKLCSEADPSKLPWGDLDIDIVFECTGRFTERDKADLHLQAGAKRVIISAPAKDEDITIVFGVNHDQIKDDHKIISNASCTTNCLAPVAKVLHEAVGIDQGFMTTIHSYTGDQRLVDTMHKDLHRARAAAMSMIPTTTGAAKAVGKVLPDLNGKLDGVSMRVPTPNVSVIDLTFNAGRVTDADEINKAVQDAASKGPLKGVLGVYDKPLVSIDFNHNPHASMFGLNETKVMDGRLVRVLSWYDNEWGFVNQMARLAQVV